jgi:hypothetical protein
VYLPLFEDPFVLRPVLEIDHALTMLRIVFPLPHIHVAVGVLAEALPTEAPVYEVALVSDTAIFHEHTEAVVFAVVPLSLVVLPLVLPDIDAVAVEVVLYELPFITVAALLEDENTETVHGFWSCWLIYL